MNVYNAEIEMQLSTPFIECIFTRSFTQKVLNWFNQMNAWQISHTTEETLFDITASFHDTKIIRKFNYTALFIRHIFIQPS